MSVLEVRRHTMRSKPGQHLSQSGVSLANYIGQSAGPFDMVVSSEKPRAIETAIAMGFATDRQVVELGMLPEEVLSTLAWPASLGNLSETVNKIEACNHFSKKQSNHWRSIWDQLSDNQTALIVTHGGIIELGAIGLAPNDDHATWGEAIGYCEGFRFSQIGGDVACEVLRVPSQFQVTLY